MKPVDALERIAYLLESSRQPTYRVRAFRNAANAVRHLDEADLRRRASNRGLRVLSGVGPRTEEVINQALAGEVPAYLDRLEREVSEAKRRPGAANGAGAPLRALLRGDCHTHSDWSDGGSPIEAMARAARDIGHEYIVLTDHSPRLTVANGLTAERLRRQLDDVAALNQELAPFRILTGIEVDILEDGSLDQEEDLLAALDVVVGSVHSKLRMESEQMTKRLMAALANPNLDILGHCTGRIIVGRGRPESTFDPESVFRMAAEHDKAIEVNSRPERLDPPKRLLRLAIQAGCKLSIDSDAHAPGQLEWQPFGCERAAACQVSPESVVNTWAAGDLTAWAAARR